MKFNTNAFIASLLLSAPMFVAAEQAEERWFEIEVILFKQLGDKNKLKEQFKNENIELPKYANIVDLLSPYLTPDIQTLKQKLPNCKNPIYPDSLVTQSSKLPAIFSERSLTEIKNAFFDTNNNGIDDIEEILILSNVNDDISETESSENITNENIDDESIIDSTALSQRELSETTVPVENSAITNSDDELTNSDSPTIKPLTDEQILLVNKAYKAFPKFTFHYSETVINDTLCQVPEELLQRYTQENPDFNKDAFAIDKLTGTVNGNEFVYSKSPYLISADSLKLGSITTSLARSRNFRPLLHVGWRQPAVAKRRAPAYKIYAGEHKKNSYKIAKEHYDIAQMNRELTNAEELEIHHDENVETELPESLTVEQVNSDILNQEIHNIIESLSSDTIIEPKIIDTAFSESQARTEISKGILDTTPPEPPLQDWLLEGFFRVHLKHYLYITADFNFLEETLSKNVSSDKSIEKEPLVIPFRQNRRVISGEVHYFDHPYMGMIVQIRRHTRPKLEEEPESSEVNATSIQTNTSDE